MAVHEKCLTCMMTYLVCLPADVYKFTTKSVLADGGYDTVSGHSDACASSYEVNNN